MHRIFFPVHKVPKRNRASFATNSCLMFVVWRKNIEYDPHLNLQKIPHHLQCAVNVEPETNFWSRTVLLCRENGSKKSKIFSVRVCGFPYSLPLPCNFICHKNTEIPKRQEIRSFSFGRFAPSLPVCTAHAVPGVHVHVCRNTVLRYTLTCGLCEFLSDQTLLIYLGAQLTSINLSANTP